MYDLDGYQYICTVRLIECVQCNRYMIEFILLLKHGPLEGKTRISTIDIMTLMTCPLLIQHIVLWYCLTLGNYIVSRNRVYRVCMNVSSNSAKCFKACIGDEFVYI